MKNSLPQLNVTIEPKELSRKTPLLSQTSKQVKLNSFNNSPQLSPQSSLQTRKNTSKRVSSVMQNFSFGYETLPKCQ